MVVTAMEVVPPSILSGFKAAAIRPERHRWAFVGDLEWPCKAVGRRAPVKHLILAGRLPKNWSSFKELRSHRPENAKIDVKTDRDVSL